MKKITYHIFRSRSRKSVPTFPAAYTTDYAASVLMVKKYGMKLDSVVYCMPEGEMINLIGSAEDYRRFGKLFLTKFLTNKNFLANLVVWSERQINSLRNYLDENLNKKIIKKISNQELGHRYKEYVGKYRNFHINNTPAWWLGADAVQIELLRELKKQRIQHLDKTFHMITESLEFKSENLKEELSLLDIAIFAKSKKINLAGKPNRKIAKKIKKHYQEFSSLPFGYYTGVVWDENCFLEKIKKLAKIDVRRKKENILSEIEAKKIKREELMRVLQLNKKITTLAVALRQLAYLQDIKKTTQTRSHPMLQKIVHAEIARRLKIPANYVNYMSVDDIKGCLSDGYISNDFKKEIKERVRSSVVVMREMKYEWLYREEAANFFEQNELVVDTKGITEFKGIVASRGISKGKAKVCKSSTEIRKVKEGDILVTAMTTPDFVPAMKKAAAIITDEGGITSHAAIVSRELGKPCIIGTKIATKVLHDGDLVEVDANKGIVKIIKKAK